MALTTWNSGGHSDPPNKHIVGSQASGPAATGAYGTLGPADVSGNAATDAASDVYGNPGDGTRMDRMDGIVHQALKDTPDGVVGAADNGGDAFIDGDSVKSFKDASGNDGDDMGGFGVNAPGYPEFSKVPGSPGFPGMPYDINSQGKDIPVKTQGSKDAKTVGRPAVRVSGTAGANPAVSGHPGFPGLP